MEAQATLDLQTSSEFIGRWNHLVSTTNWEKGRIICQWRTALQSTGASSLAYTDDAWSQQVGNVSPQHVGRLRRVFERFAEVHEQYAGLYWSHFHAALDWHDAEMYLEGAVQDGWSVSQMREKRREAMGGPAELMPSDADILMESDEDVPVYDDDPLPGAVSETFGEVHDAERFSDDRASEPFDSDESASTASASLVADDPAEPPLRPFASLPTLPADVSEAFELMKLAILNHKVSSWRDIARDDMLAVLESLKQLVLAPAE